MFLQYDFAWQFLEEACLSSIGLGSHSVCLLSVCLSVTLFQVSHFFQFFQVLSNSFKSFLVFSCHSKSFQVPPSQVKSLSGMFFNTIFWICHESIRNILQYNFAQYFLNPSPIFQECFAIWFCLSWIYQECVAIQFCQKKFIQSRIYQMFCNAIFPKVFWKSIRKDLHYNFV